ncbi:MAG: hypothetical protein WC249_02235 [Patescibacteria group bacterium]|jgi:ABC-type multidrug transport system fused ATPase/permease subunit
MINIKEQMRLLKRIRVSRNKNQVANRPNPYSSYLLIFLKQQRFLLLGTIVLLITQGIIETSLIVFSRNQLVYGGDKTLSLFFWQIFWVFFLVFIINSFLSIKQEKTVVVLLINYLRRRIFRNYLGRPFEEMKPEKQADLIAKISYHLPLVSMGISNSFFGFIRWLIYVISAVIVASLAGFNMLIILISFLILSLIIVVPAYFVVKKYVSQEVTFYSQIIKHIDLSLSEKYFLKSFNLEPIILKKFDSLVKFDSIFRVRRDLWMKMGFKIIFILLLFVSMLTHFFYNDLISWINLISPDLKFLYAFLLIYLSRVAYEALRVGLYFFPAKLGFSLTNIKMNKYRRRDNVLDIKQGITFYSRKVKLLKTGKYYRNLCFNFLKKGRYLFYGPNLSGKTTLAKLFFGAETYSSKAIKVKLDGRRLDFSDYQRQFNKVYFFDPLFYSQKSLMELILGSDREETDFSEIDRALKIMAAYPLLTGLVTTNYNFSSTADKIWTNHVAAFALHSLHCLVARPSLIIIDNAWLDLNYPDIEKILKIIDSDLPESILIVFANKKNINLKYDRHYDLAKDFNTES